MADPDEIRRFAKDLKRFLDAVEESSSALTNRFRSLGDTWRDQEHQQFAEEFENTMRVLGRFAGAADEQIPFLIRKADRLDDYLRQR